MATFSFRKFFIRIIIVLLVITGLVFAAFKVSPYPSVWLYREAFNKGGVEANQALEKYVPKGIASKLNISYDASDKEAKFDLYYPDSAQVALPTIVWTHGGGYISGSKDQVANYCKILASYGYAVVSIDYSLAPESAYPKPIRQLNTALQYLTQNAAQFPIDANQLFLAGDSAGSHISAQMAAIIVSPEYAKITKVSPKISAKQIKGMLLYCGPYITSNINFESKFQGFMQTVLWSYSGDSNFINNEYFQTSSVYNYVTKDFPATYISVGNADPLESHSEKLADRLDSLGVEVNRFFFPKGFAPQLAHEYQFNFNNDAAILTLNKSMQFVKSKTKTPENTTPDF